jgi:hypothetical protein
MTICILNWWVLMVKCSICGKKGFFLKIRNCIVCGKAGCDGCVPKVAKISWLNKRGRIGEDILCVCP